MTQQEIDELREMANGWKNGHINGPAYWYPLLEWLDRKEAELENTSASNDMMEIRRGL